MKELVFFVSFLILTTTNMIAQNWVAKDYKDEWGDPSGKRSIEQKAEGYTSMTDFKLIVTIERDVPSTDDFTISAIYSDGDIFKYMTSSPVKDGKYILRYKIGEKESSFYITKEGDYIFGTKFKVNNSKLDPILLSTSSPIRCIIAEETNNSGEVHISNLLRFTLYSANYGQLVN